MSYLYTLFGLSVWVIMVALSSSVLISKENTKQSESSKSFIERVNKEVMANTTLVTSKNTLTVKSPQEVKSTTKSTLIPKVIAPATRESSETQKLNDTYEEEEDEDGDEDD